jgi:hypothetical protein
MFIVVYLQLEEMLARLAVQLELGAGKPLQYLRQPFLSLHTSNFLCAINKLQTNKLLKGLVARSHTLLVFFVIYCTFIHSLHSLSSAPFSSSLLQR